MSELSDDMQTWKLDRIREAHGGQLPFDIRTLDDAALDEIKAGLQRLADPNEPLERGLYRRAQAIPGVNAEDEGFDLFEALEKVVTFDEERRTKVRWTLDSVNQLQTVFETEIEALSRHLDDLWYSSSDTLVVLDEQLRFLCFVTTWGEVSVLA